MRAVLIFILAVVFLSGCGDPGTSGGNRVDVRRGEFNQAQITVRSAPSGQADQVLAFQQGYIQAQDRFLQMDLSRRVGRGKLSEIFGQDAVATDRRIIGLGLPRSVEIKAEYLRQNFPEPYSLLEAYARGVNQYLAEIANRSPDVLKNYRQITGDRRYIPARWEPADSVSAAQNIAFYLSSNIQEKMLMGSIAAAISGGTDATSYKLTSALDLRPIFNNFILDADPKQNYWRKRRAAATPPAPSADVLASLPRIELPSFGCMDLPYPFPECGRKAAFGSNNWVVSKEFAGGDTAYLANDPHLRMTFPMPFYEGAYDSTPAGGTIRVRGFGLVGVPGVLIGHNDRIAWGLTNVGADVDDVYLEVLDTQTYSKSWQLVDGKPSYIPIKEIPIELKVRNLYGGLDPQPIVLRWTQDHGPVFTDHEPRVQAILDKFAKTFSDKFKVVGAYRWAGHEKSSEFVAMLGVNRAANYAEARASLKEFGAGAQNIVFADSNGDIAYYAHGAYPIRPYASEGQSPLMPVIPFARHMTGRLLAAFRAPAEWAGFRQEVPELVNPTSGRIVTANNDPYGHSAEKSLSGYQDYFSYGFSTGVRAQRITDLLEASKGKITLDTMKAIQGDYVDLSLKNYLAVVGNHREELALSPAATELLDRLLAWDCEMHADLNEPLVADIWLTETSRAYLHAAAPKLTTELVEGIERTSILGRTLFHRVRDGLAAGGNVRKASLALMSVSLERAAKRIEEEGLRSVRWGQVNRLYFFNQLQGLMPGFVSIPVERHGSWETINVAGHNYGPALRLIYSVTPGKPIEAITAVPGGNYGMLDREHLYPEILRWQRAEYRELVPFLN